MIKTLILFVIIFLLLLAFFWHSSCTRNSPSLRSSGHFQYTWRQLQYCPSWFCCNEVEMLTI
uniref:Nodule Cysteine-Rich (NCR) secreted peptide n=1 Tax=Medicago truncatula TaxID=3880 RepID=I3T2N0_MEDTR|nr:unknown [Medicago truncatula]